MGARTGVIAAVMVGAALCAGGCGGESSFDISPYLTAYRTGRSAEAAARPQTDPAPARLLPDMDKPVGTEPGGAAETGATQPVGEGEPGGPAHWSRRRGPAYPNDALRTIGRDFKELPATVWDDTKATFTDRTALILLAAAGVAKGIIRTSGLDEEVEDKYDYDGDSHGSWLNSEWDGIGGFFGSPAVHFPAAGLMYLTALARKDVKGYETSKALINALSINGLLTLGLKYTFSTHSPNGDPFAWPSGHTSSSFCFATVMHDAYGPWVGVPLFAFATFVAYERVDARNHDFSDVVSGALIGIAIGHAVMRNHEPRIFGFDVVPIADPQTGAMGVGLAKRF